MGEFPRSSLKDVADVGRIVYRACGRIGSKILCTSKARNPRYGACARIRRRKRHLFAVQAKGWREPTIQKLKKLVQPFHSDDPIMRDCHERAANSGAGIVVYSDPIEDA
jgi:hypothetical protein